MNIKRGLTLSEKDKQELLEMARSGAIKEDFRRMSLNRHNPFIANGAIDIDRFVSFLNDYNEFINHVRRPFRRIIDKDMKL